MGSFYIAPGLVDGACHVFLAKELRQTNENEKEEEGIEEVITASWVKVEEMVSEGKINSASTISALQLARLHLGR